MTDPHLITELRQQERDYPSLLHAPLCGRAADEIEWLRNIIRGTICPGGGYTGQPSDEEPTVDACLKAGVCGCTAGAAVERAPTGKQTP